MSKTRNTTCRRCSECPDGPHHWVENSDFGNDPETAEEPTGNEYVCKHCDAVGDDCPDCGGILYDYDGSPETDCSSCGGSGIVETTPRQFSDLEDV